MRMRLAIGVTAILLLWRAADATTIIPVSFQDLVRTADTIFVGEVVEQHAEWENSRDGRSIITVVTFNVARVLKGRAGLATQLTFLGGTIDDATLQVGGMPQFHVGDRDMIFTGPASERLISPLVGFAQGRIRIDRDARTGVDRVRRFDGAAFTATSALGQPRSTSLSLVDSMSLADFESEVRRAVAGTAK
jgi:hypothetical protein